LPELDRIAQTRHLCRTDIFFLLGFICGRNDIWDHPQVQWLIDRCREIESAPNGRLDLWAREHYKSTLITFGLTLQDILSSHGKDPDPKWDGREVTVGIFSCTRPIAKGFLRQIRMELETNETLKAIFPDILYQNPKRDAPKWSEDDGLIVKRKSNPKESTLESWGLVDGQPTSKHFMIRVYDDVVTLESVRSSPMIKKTTESLEMSYNLGTEGGYERFTGTRYRFNDTYASMLKRGIETRIHPCYPCDKEGKAIGDPVLQSQEYLDEKRRKMGPYVFACQMLLNPKADEIQGFKEEWLSHYKPKQTELRGNIYIIMDPANEKKKHSDYTAGWVLEACEDQKVRVREILRDRLGLIERTDWLMKMHRRYTGLGKKPLGVGYEKYGKDADIDHIEDVMDRESYKFRITPLGGGMAKEDRIRLLIPMFSVDDSKGIECDILLPTEYYAVNYEGRREDLVRIFIDDEYNAFPIMEHDDMLDALARIKDDDMRLTFPMPLTPGADYEHYEFTPDSGKGFVF
jgi:hypothetical protein